MITLYHCAGSRSLRALWALEEMRLPYELVKTPFPPRAKFAGYLELNPLGTTPLLVDNGSRMTESVAIAHYLATRYGPTELAVRSEETAYANYLNFLVMGEATLTFPQTIFLRYTRLEPKERRLEQAADDYAHWFRSRLRAASHMVGPRYVCADRFTMADISFSYALMMAEAIGLDDVLTDRLKDYLADLKEREGYKRAIAA